jgi:phenylacetate-CoA ligase
MPVLDSLRRNIYWAFDYVKGCSVRKHLHDLNSFNNKGRDDNGLIERRLGFFLKHAVETVPFYAGFNAQSLLQDFPIVSKQTFKEHFDKFFSQKYSPDRLYHWHTSGSYGTPFTFFFTPDKKARKTAELIYFNRLTGFNLGMRHIHIAIRSKSRFTRILQNQIVVDPMIMSPGWAADVWRLIIHKNIPVIVGYTSSLMYLAEWLKGSGSFRNHSLKIVIAIAEPLGDEKRAFLQNTFQCPVISRYASTEAGVIAQERIDDPRFFVNTASLIIEVVNQDSDEPVKPGEVGRLLLTDLFSYAMPFIRYDIGDMVRLADDSLNEGGVRVLDSVEGRAVEIVTAPDGTRISPIAIDDVFDSICDIDRFKFIQNGWTTYHVILIASPSELRECTIRNKLYGLLGRDIVVSFEYVDDIPALPSGKRPYVVNKMALDGSG